MKIVITGKDSYIGNSFQHFAQAQDEHWFITQLNVTDDTWENFNFSEYDAVVHVAAIVHRKDVTDWALYKRVNTDLAVRIAEKAKAQGVKRFVFLSTMAVYGKEKTLCVRRSVINESTEEAPLSMYGKSKHMAEVHLRELEDEHFQVAIVRPPNVYGPGCKGGYISTYKRIVAKLPVIPKAYTALKQSIIYIDNLSCLLFLLIKQGKSGMFMPQDGLAPSAVELMQMICATLGRKKRTCALVGSLIYPLSFLPMVIKGYGGISYRQELSEIEGIDYRLYTVQEGLERTLRYEDKRHHSGI